MGDWWITEKAEKTGNIWHRELKKNGSYASYRQLFKGLSFSCGSRFSPFLFGRKYKLEDSISFTAKNLSYLGLSSSRTEALYK